MRVFDFWVARRTRDALLDTAELQRWSLYLFARAAAQFLLAWVFARLPQAEWAAWLLDTCDW